MDTVTFDVEGVAELNQFLTELPREIVAAGFVQALHAGGEIIERTLVFNCPEKEEDTGGILEQGELRASINLQVKLDSQLRGGQAQIGFRGPGPNAVANWIEYGHRLVGHKPKKKFIRQLPPNPFIRRTVDQAAQPAVDAFMDSLMGTLMNFSNISKGAY